MSDMLMSLHQRFEEAAKEEDAEKLASLLSEFDVFCREQVESQNDDTEKEQLIRQLLNTQQSWQSKILQLKSKVQQKIADIKSNGKKINKYLTSY
ncbi:MAG: hypothetical protein HWE10_07140 [Gammaproteobacteria bacterium]|nr:hypothetical protein [Gammaproteobacteria bacterium]